MTFRQLSLERHAPNGADSKASTCLSKEKVDRLSEASKRLLKYLLHHGKTELNELMRQCCPQDDFNEAIQMVLGFNRKYAAVSATVKRFA